MKNIMKNTFACMGRLLSVALVLLCLSACSSSDEQDREPGKPKADANGFDYVDLGLSVKWATCNVGADVPEDPGDLFSWGEVETKEEFKWNNYVFFDENRLITKYCTNEKKGVNDGLTTLLPEDDAAHTRMGGDWRMPTIKELRELMACPKEEIFDGTSFCWKITGPNGNSILIPGKSSTGSSSSDYSIRTTNAKEGGLWSSSLCVSYEQAQTFGCGIPLHMAISNGKPTVIIGSTTIERFRGAAVRGVID